MGDGDTSERLNYKIAEYSKAVLLDKPNFHISFIMNVSPECDCWNHNDAAIVPDLGIAASFDPVALDKACADIVINAPILETGNRLSDSPHHDHLEGCDKFHIMHPFGFASSRPFGRMRQNPHHASGNQLAGRTGTCRKNRTGNSGI